MVVKYIFCLKFPTELEKKANSMVISKRYTAQANANILAIKVLLHGPFVFKAPEGR